MDSRMILVLFAWVSFCPSMYTFPLVGSSRKFMHRTVVDLPEPEGPMITSFSPSFTSRFTFFSTWRSPKFLHTFSSLIILLLHSAFRAGIFDNRKRRFYRSGKNAFVFMGYMLYSFVRFVKTFISLILSGPLLPSPADCPPDHHCCSMLPRQTRIPHPVQYRFRGYCGHWEYSKR